MKKQRLLCFIFLMVFTFYNQIYSQVQFEAHTIVGGDLISDNPKSEYITLKIYDLLGKEVTTLVSNKLTPGNYKYTWDAYGLASGIYYYKIQFNFYINTKKLLLLK